MADLKKVVLSAVDADTSGAGVSSIVLADANGVEHQAMVGAIKSLQAFEGLLVARDAKSETWELTAEGQAIVEQGSPELRVLAAIPVSSGGVSKADLEKLPAMVALGADVCAQGLKQATRFKWVGMAKDKATGTVTVTRKTEGDTLPVDTLQAQLKAVAADASGVGVVAGSGSDANESPAKVLKELKKRKLVAQRVVKSLVVGRGPAFTLNPVKAEAGITEDMLQDGSWRTKAFKPFNWTALGVPATAGVLHPLLKVRREYREIFLELGFSEMPTNQYVESSFWNFDALFQPQQHPARDAHDTFFLSEPAASTDFPPEYLARVKATHETGGETGSIGYRMDWKLEEAQKNILRTHTTAVSARMLYKLAQQKPFKPAKYFSIDRVFRNESLDATHLAEFHQIEGLMADYNLTLGDLMGTLSAFFKRLGIENLQFKPAYNPYTEPSMEVFSYHEGLDKVVEIGNSGIFRPEMLEPMGLPKDVVVIAWGLSLERPTMIKYKYQDIRDLMGHSIDLDMARKQPMVRI